MSTDPNRSKPLTERKQLAFEYRKAGVPAGSVAKRLGFRGADAVDKIVAEKLEADRASAGAFAWYELEVARLDDLQQVLTLRMRNGDAAASRELLQLLDYRIRLESARNREPGRMYRAVERACGDLTLTAADDAAKQSALDMAAMIDAAMSVGTADDQRRAINAMATMRNLLNDLGASPAAREELDGIVRSGSSERAGEALAAAGDAPVMPEKGAEVLDFMAMARERHRA